MKGANIAIVGIFAAAIAATTGDSLGAQNAAEVVKQRQESMKQMGRAFRPVMAIVKGENPNIGDAMESALTWQKSAAELLAGFPEATGRDVVPESRAKPEVWTKFAEFNAAADKLADESGKLVEAVKSNDMNVFSAQFKAFGAACGGCHEGPSEEGGKFRFPKAQ